MKSITLFSKNGCVQCDMTKRVLDKKGLDYQIRMVDAEGKEGEEALAQVRSLGYNAMPVVVAEDRHWAGFQPAQLAML